MPRVPRSHLPDGVFHVTARGAGGIHVFREDVDRLEFLALLDTSAARHSWACHAYCLMGTHYHLVVEAARERLSAGMHRLNGIYAQRFNRRHGRRGHLFESRYSAWTIGSDAHLEAACHYVLASPVRAGLCGAPTDWPWSGRPASSDDPA